jgi:hypothetical protein
MSGSLEEKKTLLAMARVFRTDIQDIQQRGAGYYSCSPFVNRFNKLLTKCRELFSGAQTVILESFDELEDTKSVDPADKMKVTQRVIIELGQLIAFMESVIGRDSKGAGDRAASTEKDSNPATEKQGSNKQG